METTGSGNTVTIEVQLAQEFASSVVGRAGLASFDSTGFDVDANGFVTLTGGGTATTNMDVDAFTPPGTDPVLPDGGGNIVMTGAQVAAGVVGTNVIRTDSLAANTVTIEIQRSSAVAATDVSQNGVAHFNSNEFTVDGNGFVSLLGGGEAIDSIAVQTGTSPILPTVAGLVTINGAVVAAGTNPVRSDGTGANTMAIEVQISQALAATDATKIGLANFDSAAFDVDANGFVQLNGGGIATTSFDIQANTAPGTDPVVPTAAGVVTVNGAAVANHSVVLETRSRAANAYNLEVQYSAAAVATDATKSGVAHFDSARFTVDANGFVSVNGSGIGETITGQSGGALSPTAGNWNIYGGTVAAGTSPVATSGSGSTLTTNVQISQAIASTNATNIGLAAFDSAAFDVDANGFVQLNGGGIAATSFDVQANTAPGTDPVLPSSSGVVTVNGAAVAAHSVVLETRSRAANAYNVEIQYASAAASTTANQSGVAHFDSAAFDVDANGFVQLNGGGVGVTSVNVDASTPPGTDPVLASATGEITVTGAQVAAGSTANVIRTNSLAANTYTIEVQRSSAQASSTIGSNGVAHFDSTSFSVDANGFVQSVGGGFTWNDVSGAFSPLKNNGYFITGTATGTLPASPAQGDTIKFFVDHASQVLTIDAPGTQIIRIGSLVTSAGGTAVSTLQGDSLELVYRTSDTCWCAIAGVTGTWVMS